jgi:sortase A
MKGLNHMKMTLAILILCVLCMSMSVPAFAFHYEFSTGEDTMQGFGKATSNNDPVSPDPMSENTRRNKDAAFLPPPYGVFNGNIPTDPSSLFHDNLPDSGFVPSGQQYPATGSGDYAPGSLDAGAGMLPSTSLLDSAVLNTAPRYYEDGSIGSIYVARTKKTVTVYEGEDAANLKKGAGHFTTSSAWDGNVVLCGHNRGNWPYFSFVKDMKNGDTVTYTTPYGSRTYEVISREQIDVYDHSKLGWSEENLLTLITCIEDTPELRWAATLCEVQ